MANFDETRKKLLGKYAPDRISTSSAPVSSGSGKKSSEDPVQRFEATRTKLLSKYDKSRLVDENYVQAFQRDAAAHFESIPRYNGTRESFNTLNQRVADLRSRAFHISQYLDKSEQDDNEELRSYLNEVTRALSDAQYGLYSSSRERWDLLEYDVKAGQQEIQDMDLAIEKLRQRVNGRWQARNTQDGRSNSPNLFTDDRAELKDLAQQRSEKSRYLNRARNLQEAAELGGVADPDSDSYDRDFQNYSRADAGVDDLTYRYINGDDDGARSDIRYQVKASPALRQGRTAELHSYDQMTEQEIGIYNYYYAKEGKEKAEQYLDSIQEQLNSRLAEARFGKLEANTALEMLFGVEAGLDQFVGGVRNLFDSDSSYIAPSSTQFVSGMVRDNLKDVGINLPKWMGGASLGQVGYDAVTTTANMAPSILASSFSNAIVPGSGTIVGSALMSGSAIGSAYQEALNLGYDKGQARAYAALIGASEGSLQYLLGGISALGGTGRWTAKMLDGIDNGLFRVAGKLGANMLSEGLEEGLQEVLTPAFQNLVLHTDEDINWSEVAYSALLGALTAGVMESGGTFAADRAVSRTGQQVRDAGQVQRLQEIGSTMSADSAAYQLAGKVDGNTGAYTIGRLFNEVGVSLTEQNRADIAASLESKGMDSRHAALHAEVMGYIVDGGQLSDVQMKLIESNDVLAHTLQEVIINPNSTVYQRQTGYNEMLRSLANQKAGVEASAQAQAAPDGAEPTTVKQGQAVSQTSQVRARTAQERQAEQQTVYLKEADTPVSIAGIASTEGGKLTFRTEDGQTVSSADVELGSMGPVYEAVAGLEVSPGIGNAIVAGYQLNPELTPTEYAMQAQNAFRFGKMGIPLKQVLASPAANLLDGSTLDSIYGLGRTYSTDRTTARQQRVQQRKAKSVRREDRGIVTAASMDIWQQMNQFQQEQYTVMTHIADILGSNIMLHSSREAGWANVNGRYDPDTDTIHLNIDAGMSGQGTMMFTLAHELTHRIYQWSPQKFKTLADFLMEQYGKKGVSVEELIEAKLEVVRKTYEGQNLTEEQLHDRAFEEVVADSMEPMLTDGRVLQELKAQEPGIWEQIRSWVQEMAEKIRKAYARLKPDSAEGRAVLAMKDSIEEIEKLFLEGLQDSAQAAAGGQKNTAPEGGQMAASVRYSMKQSEIDAIQAISKINSTGKVVGKSVNEFTSAEVNVTERFARRYWQELGIKSPFFRAWFGDWRAFDKSPVHIATKQGNNRGPVANTDTGWTINISRQVINETTSHNDSSNKAARKYLAYIDDIVSKAVLLETFTIPKNKAKSANSLLMHSFYAVADVGNGPEVLKLYVEEMNDPAKDNTAKRAYQLQNVEKYRNLHRGHSNTASSKSAGSGVSTVSDLFTVVKARDKNFQPKEVNPVLLNENGTPKVFYHGTPNGDFTVFRDWQYFSDSKSYANVYQEQGASSNGYKQTARNRKTYETYLAPKKVFDTRKPKERRIFLNEFYRQWGNGAPLSDKGLPDWTDGDDFIEFFEEKGYDYDAILLDEGATGGYGDDVKSRGVSVVVRDSSSIKSAIDNIGTFDRSNPDIRYQERDAGLNRVNEALRSEKEGLREDFDETKAIFDLLDIREKEGIFTQGSLEATARKLKQTAEATGSTKELAGLLQEGFQTLAEMKNPSWADVENHLQPAVDWMMEHQKKYRDPRAQEALHDILTSKVYLDKKQKAEAAYLSGSYNDYRRQVGFRMFTDKGSISLDSQWKEWANDYPEFFDANATSTDMPRLLKELIPRLRTMQTDMTFGIDAVGMEQDLLRQVYDGMIRAAVYPAQGQILSWRDIKIQDLTREQAEQVQKIVRKHERQMQRLKKNHDAEMTGIRENFERQNAWRRESREKTELRHRIQRTVKQVNSMLTRETKTRHIPEVLKLAVVDALDAVNMDTVMAEERLKTLREQLAITSDPDSRAEIEQRIRTVTEMGGSLKKKLDSLSAAYAAIRADADPTLAYAFDEEIGNQIQQVKDFVGNTPLREMSKAQLEAVDELYTAVMTRVRDMNKAFATARQESIDGLGQAVISQEISQKQTDQRLSMLQPLRAFSWNNEKPVYAFERLGSATLTELYNNIRKGEDVYAQDMEEARGFQNEMAKRFHRKDWDTKKTFTFHDRLGKEFNLTLGQMMTLYAYSKRPQAWDHLQYGGFQFAPETQILKRTKAGFDVAYDWTSARTFKVDAQILADIVSQLTAEQKEFADRMQSYLSDTMGAKGNEISMKLYGIRLFKERNYFPLKSSQAFLEQEKNKANGEVKIKNKGFTKQVQKYANNPVMLRSFDDIWADHVGEMSMYHGFTLPLEDFYRVRNYKEGIFDEEGLDEPTESRSVVSAIQNAHGKEAVQYIEQLLKDLNGGAVGDPRAAIGKSLTSKHKKAAVMASLSVIVQQPTSIFRAWAVVDPKYFGADNLLIPTAIKTINAKQHRAAWAELKQYAPVAILKEMGSFDTSVGRSGRDYLNAPEYEGLKERTKALLTDGSYRDEVLGKAAAAADEMAWVAIWDAVKKETADRHRGLLSQSREEFMQIAGERFTEVISKTQVYDSVLSRSSNMRSKDIYMNMATSFMAEPTVTVNMVEDAIRKWKRGNKKATGKIFAGVLASHVMNSMLVSLVYAMRDDDEDETYAEKYVSRLATELIDGMNPLTYIPFARDIWSVFQGYDVERADMTLVADLAAALKAREKLLGTDTADMDEEELQAYRKNVSDANWGLVDILGSLVGLPEKNFRRDVMGIKNFFATLSRGRSSQKTTYSSLVDEVLSEVRYTLPGGKTGLSNQDKLYGAIMAGDSIYVQRLKAGYRSESAYNSALRKVLREKDPRIRQAAQQRSSGQIQQYRNTVKEILAEKHFTQDDVVAAVNAEINTLNKGDSVTAAAKAKSLYSSDDFRSALIQGSSAMAKEIREELIRIDQVNGKTREEAEKSFVSSARSTIKEGCLDGSLSRQKAEKALTEYCGISAEEARADTEYWAFAKKHPDIYANEQWFEAYYEEVADSGIGIGTYMEYRNQVREITGEGKKARRMEVIHSLPITDAQKDALYFAEGWSDSRLYEAPWH